ncbi:MAG: hypothetical protein EXR07_09455 [Acetobacteraceae bacterium]|nr:hypothetical protein [Acetobacteraceae bacterium]
MGKDRFHPSTRTTARRLPGLMAIGLVLIAMVAGCETSPPPPLMTQGGFDNGDPASIPAFRERLTAARPVVRQSLPKVGGGNAGVIRTLLSPTAIAGGQRLPGKDETAIRGALLRSLDHPSAKPARLFYISRAFAFRDREHPIVLLICDTCGTAALAMRATGADQHVVLSPQLDIGDLGLPVVP